MGFITRSLSTIYLQPWYVAGSLALAVASAIPIWIWKRVERKRNLEKLRPGRLIAITGCDSGLGLAMSFWSAKAGYKVLAGCYDLNSQGSKFLRQKFSKSNLHITQLDVTKEDSLENFKITCQNILQSSESPTELWALIPNAGVGCFGEFFWMKESISRRIMEVNFWGTVNLVNTFHGLLFRFKSRLLIVTSDCADFPLPGLSIYSASKAALQNWASALRLEVSKFGITVTSFQPGNFPTQSRLFSGQRQAYEEMKANLSPEDNEFLGEYFEAYNAGLIAFLESASIKELRDDTGIERLFLSLLERNLSRMPLVSRNPVSLQMIHFLFKYLPTSASDWLKTRLLQPPNWQPKDYPGTVLN